jgi:hypothetical protein
MEMLASLGPSIATIAIFLGVLAFSLATVVITLLADY